MIRPLYMPGDAVIVEVIYPDPTARSAWQRSGDVTIYIAFLAGAEQLPRGHFGWRGAPGEMVECWGPSCSARTLSLLVSSWAPTGVLLDIEHCDLIRHNGDRVARDAPRPRIDD